MTEVYYMLKLESNPRNIARVEPYVEQIFRECGISHDLFGNVLISLTEAVNNAIVHGNQQDESKYVEIHLRRSSHTLAFIISDEGGGFDYNNLPDPTAPENLFKIGGRGVFLMKQLSDDVQFLDGGRSVEINFNLDS